MLIAYFSADSWPEVLDDTNARMEWDWKPDYDLGAMTKTMLEILTSKYKQSELISSLEVKATMTA